MAKNRSKVMRRKIIAARLEATTGAEETVGQADYVEAFDASLPFDDTFNKRQGVGLGNRAGVAGAQSASPTFKTELRNSGTATPPISAMLLAAAGFKNTGGVFSLQGAADAGDTATIAMNVDGVFVSTAGAVFNVKISGEVGKPVMVEWTGKGKRFTGAAGPRDVTPIATAPMSGLPPVLKGITATIGAQPYCFSKFELDMGNDVQLRPCATDPTGFLAAQIVGRDPKLTLDPELRSIASKNFYADYEAGTLVPISIAIGAGANGTVTIGMPNAQLAATPTLDDGAGLARQGLTFQACETAGDDEVTITYA